MPLLNSSDVPFCESGIVLLTGNRSLQLQRHSFVLIPSTPIANSLRICRFPKIKRFQSIPQTIFPTIIFFISINTENNTSFDTQEYEKQVFQSNSVIESFQDFKEAYQNQRKITLGEQFEISDYALKKHSRVFKSVIKLDKNFHIYIHGDKNKIEKGEDHHGRKYYVLYYENESWFIWVIFATVQL